MSRKSRAVAAVAVQEYLPKITRGLPVGSTLVCADNSGARVLKLIQVVGLKTRHRRIPAARVGDLVVVSVREGKPELRKQLFKAVIVRQRKMYRRKNGVRVFFEDNAAVLLTPEGDLKGTEIRGPVAKEAAERWVRIANVATIIV